jgi:hypothetical protein
MIKVYLNTECKRHIFRSYLSKIKDSIEFINYDSTTPYILMDSKNVVSISKAMFDDITNVEDTFEGAMGLLGYHSQASLFQKALKDSLHIDLREMTIPAYQLCWDKDKQQAFIQGYKKRRYIFLEPYMLVNIKDTEQQMRLFN